MNPYTIVMIATLVINGYDYQQVNQFENVRANSVWQTSLF